MIAQIPFLPVSSKLQQNLDQIESDRIKILFLERQNLQQSSLSPLNRSWENLTTISLGYNNIRLINNLHQCYFPELIELYLNNNNIESIEALTLMQMPKLKKLSLKTNKIHSITSLRKGNFQQLSYLSLYGNRIKQFNRFSEIQAKELSKLQLQFSNHFTMGEQIRFLFKSESKRMQKLSILSIYRIKQTVILEKLKQKYPRLLI